MIRTKIVQPNDFTAEQVHLSVVPGALSEPVSANSFGVFLANMSQQYAVGYVAITPAIPGDLNDVHWAPIRPPISRTCDRATIDECNTLGMYQILATVPCGSKGYCSIAYQNAADGLWYAGTFREAVDANCASYNGVVYGLA